MNQRTIFIYCTYHSGFNCLADFNDFFTERYIFIVNIFDNLRYRLFSLAIGNNVLQFDYLLGKSQEL